MKTLVPLGLAACLLLVGCGAQPGEPTAGETAETRPAPSATPSPTPTPTPTNRCALDPASASLEEKVGYLFMMGRDATAGPVDEEYQKVMADHHIRAVVLLGNTTVGTAGVKDIVSGLDPDGTVLVAADQEGGQVQRLQGEGFDSMPSAAEQASMSDADLTVSATQWAEQLAEAGVDMNLAPVADVVPEDVGESNEPVAALQRGYGADPDVVTAKSGAYIAGMQEGGQLTSVKHFPGLGAVTGNTDFTSDVVDDRTTRDDPALAPFHAAAEGGVDSIMVATARYDRIDDSGIAAFSPVVIDEMIREDLGFDGVVISDDMGAAAQVADVPPGDRAVRFFEAGGDLLINGDPSLQPEMTQAVLDRAATDEAFAGEIDEKVRRVAELHAKTC